MKINSKLFDLKDIWSQWPELSLRFLIPFSYSYLFSCSFRQLKPAIWLIFCQPVLLRRCWIMGMKMIVVMINIWDRGLSYWSQLLFSNEPKTMEETLLYFSSTWQLEWWVSIVQKNKAILRQNVSHILLPKPLSFQWRIASEMIDIF